MQKLNKVMAQQKGVALIIFALVVALVLTSLLISQLDAPQVKIARDKTTAVVLAQAKAALIARAVMDSNIPGSLPCPSTSITYDGVADTLSASNCPNYIGWYPWKTLSTGDIRDGNSERLWYVISPAYRDNLAVLPLNSDTAGTLNVDGTSDIVAIIFAPGTSISQSRPSNNVVDYLEGTNTNGDTTYSAMLSATQNDKLITISRDEIMRPVEKRVAGEVLSCLKDYNKNSNVIPISGLPDGDGNLDRHPWSTNGAGSYPSFADADNSRFGRIPDNFNNTRAFSFNIMSSSWSSVGVSCRPITDGWWSSWKELVFYAVGDNHDPNSVPSPSLPSPNCVVTFPNDCLSVTAPSGIQNNKKVVVIVAGKTLAGQLRTTTAQKGLASNYLESTNAAGGTSYTQLPVSAAFNDIVVTY
jgi:hypothetical protein